MQSTAEYSEPSGSSFFFFILFFTSLSYAFFMILVIAITIPYFHNCNRNNIFLFLHQPYSAQLQAYVFHSFSNCLIAFCAARYPTNPLSISRIAPSHTLPTIAKIHHICHRRCIDQDVIISLFQFDHQLRKYFAIQKF